ncbi:MAG: TIGR02099 family protein [Betaproteobacteria bacterium]|nr:TIGR02099 family protein [Betaproteobacteria bacterium]
MTPRVIKLLRRAYHYAFYVVGGAVFVVCVVALALRFWILPNISAYEGLLEEAASTAVGQPVDVGALEADWHGLNPRVVLRDVRIQPPTGAPLLLPRVEAVGSWLSLALFDLRLSHLLIEQPQVAVRRDADGLITLAGIPLNTAGEPSPFPDWLLRQPRILVKDAELTWLDEKLEAPQLRFSQVRLLLENRFGRHRFGGVALPDINAAGRLELRGDFRGRGVQDLASWNGEAYARVDDARLDQWGRWVPWAQGSVKGGVGSLRFWLDVKNGEASGLLGDARLEKVVLNLHPDLPDMVFDSLGGRIGWSRDRDSQSYFVEKLRFQRAGITQSEPASLRVSLAPDGKGGYRRVGATASNLRLETVTALAGALPLPRQGRDLLDTLKPRGLVESGEGHWESDGRYSLKLRLREAGAQAYGNLPGISGLSARVQANQDEGRVELASPGLHLDWPRVFRHALAFSHLDARADWRTGKDGLRLDFDVERIANADLEGSAQGRIELPRTGFARVDLGAHLSHGQATAVYRYLPHAVGEDAYAWLRDSLLGGHSDDVRLTLRGDLQRFPFDQGGGTFNIAINMVNGVLRYAPDWPLIRDINGLLRFHDKAMTLEANSGGILATRIGAVKVVIPDLVYTWDEVVLVDGLVQGDTQSFLDFIRQSPVHAHTDGFTAPFKAQGRGELSLRLRLPVRRLEATTVSGSFNMRENRLEPGGGLPLIEAITGSVRFTDKDLQAKDVRVQVAGMPAMVDLSGGGAPDQPGGVRIVARGRVGADLLKPEIPDALAKRLSGATDWRADIGLNAAGRMELAVSSDLSGLRINLPAPLGKNAADVIPLRVTRRPEDGNRSSLHVRYGEQVAVRAELERDAPTKMQVRLGPGDAPAPTDPGMWISGNLRFIDLDAWLGLRLHEGAERQGGEALPLRGAQVTFNEARVIGRRLHDTSVRLRPAGNGWQVNLAGREVVGEVITVPEDGKTRVLANFKRLALPDAEPGATPVPGEHSDASLGALDLLVGKLTWKGHELSDLRLRMAPARGGYQVEHFQVAMPDSRLEGKGVLAEHPRQITRMDLKLDSGSLGKMLGNLGKPGLVKDGPMQVSGQLGWTGGLEDFSLASLFGDLDVKVRQGQFLKADPGVAKLLGILSLQALPRRIALDFRDIFTEGFAFQDITGNIHLERGSAYTNDLRMNGAAARVSMSGVIDLQRESQNLRVSVQPRLDDSLAVAGALLGGPVVGLGTLIAGKVLKDPVGQATTFEYSVTGGWAEPNVSKLTRRKAEGAGDKPPAP